MLIWLASYPRAGNTLFRMTMNVLFGAKTYSEGDRRVFDQMDGLTDLVGHRDLPDSIEALRNSAESFAVKTHKLPDDASPAVYIVRDGRDCLVSYAHYRMKFRKKPASFLARWTKRASDESFEAVLKELVIGRDVYGGWQDHVFAWVNRTSTTALIKYEDLVQDPVKYVTESLEKIGYPLDRMHEGDLPSFEEMHQKWPNFFRKGTVGSATQEMSAKLEELFWKHHGEAMEAMGYSRERRGGRS